MLFFDAPADGKIDAPADGNIEANDDTSPLIRPPTLLRRDEVRLDERLPAIYNATSAYSPAALSMRDGLAALLMF